MYHYTQTMSFPSSPSLRARMARWGTSAEVKLGHGEVEEFCPNRLAPATSTTLTPGIAEAPAAGLPQIAGHAPDRLPTISPRPKAWRVALVLDCDKAVSIITGSEMHQHATKLWHAKTGDLYSGVAIDHLGRRAPSRGLGVYDAQSWRQPRGRGRSPRTRLLTPCSRLSPCRDDA